MSYKIQYNMSSKTERNYNKQFNKNIGIVYLTIVLLICLFIGKHLGSAEIRKFLIPGDDAVTSAAFAEMTNQIQQGTEIKEAFTNFCMEIIENARIS